ncbi:hypothetical protein JNW90_14520 [Micromonospora sp. STR1s_5]|nr:hypothetical protein [Micromonospora sp. STR1s_5]
MDFIHIGRRPPEDTIVRLDLSSTGEYYPDEWPLDTRAVWWTLLRSWGGLAVAILIGIAAANAIADRLESASGLALAQRAEPNQTGAIKPLTTQMPQTIEAASPRLSVGVTARSEDRPAAGPGRH